MDLKLENKMALVTGSTAGIGFAIAKSLAAEGCRVIVNGRSEDRVAGSLEKIRQAHSQAKLQGLAIDLAKLQGTEETIQRFPTVDILVNNLGIYGERPFEDISDIDWQKIIEINFMNGVRLSRHYLPRMKAEGWGRIIFLSSGGQYPGGNDPLRRYQGHVPGPEPKVWPKLPRARLSP